PTDSGDYSALCTRQRSGRRHRSLQVLAKFPQHTLTQKIGIEFACFCKLDNSFDDSFTNKIVLVAKLKGCASHFECDAHDPLGLGIDPIALAGYSREDTDDFRNVFCLRYPIKR